MAYVIGSRITNCPLDAIAHRFPQVLFEEINEDYII